MEYEEQGRRVTRFSVMGYSLGGLIARYVIGCAPLIHLPLVDHVHVFHRILHQNKFFEAVTPVNFNTIATPHVGIPSFPTAQSSIRSFFGRNFMSRTGQQFYCADKWSPNGRTLIEVLGDPGQLSSLQAVYPLDDIVQNIYFTRHFFSSQTLGYMRMRRSLNVITDMHQC